MKIITKKTGKEALIVVPIAEDGEARLSQKTQALFKEKGFSGKKLSTLLAQGKPSLLFVGTGKDYDHDMTRKVAGIGAKKAREERVKHYALDLRGLEEGHVQAAVEGSVLGLYKYEEYKRRGKDEPADPSALTIITDLPQKQASQEVKKGLVMAEATVLARDLVNRPGSDKYPARIAGLAKELGKQHGFAVTILGLKELEKLGMHALLAVAKGTDKEPQVVVMELNGQRKDKPLALVGKGVTFDAGGLQVKPDKYMNDMKYDMGGGAAVLGAMVALARTGHQGRVIGAIGLVENMVGPDAYKPGDILTAHNGKTIEVVHTDAEGRLVLADVLSYLQKAYKPRMVVDIATLTGATMFALGYRVASVIGDEHAVQQIKEASKATDELVWELPLYNHYRKMVEGSISDLLNNTRLPGNYSPGAITAAAFLNNFVEKGVVWAHIDIAGTAISYEETEYVSKGGTGWGVRLLAELASKER